MSNTKELKTRIRLRYDSFENWSKVNAEGKGIELLEGEIAIAYLGPTKDTTRPNPDDVTKHPIMFKVGPGEFNKLPWASALAADVYSWAKEPNKPTYDADEIKVDTENNHFNGKGIDAALAEIWTEIVALTGGEEGAGAIADQIKAGIKAIQGATATAGNYVTGVSIDENGNLKLAEATLPTLATGDTDGTVKFNNVEVAVKGLGSAAYKNENDFVASVSNTNASIAVSGDSTAPQIAVALSAATDNAITLENDGLKVVIPEVAIPNYTIEKAATPNANASTTYNLMKDGVATGSAIDIPKDMVVSSGAVVELAADNDEGLAAGTYIKLVLANSAAEALYIPVGSLIEYVTTGSKADDMVVIDVDSDHKVTASITDGKITLAKLESNVQNKINNALNAEQVKAVKVDKASDSDSLGGIAAANYLTGDEAPGYNDIFTKTAADSTIKKASTAVQNVTAADITKTVDGEEVTVKSGLVATKNEETNIVNIAIDDSITFIFNCGGAEDYITE